MQTPIGSRSLQAVEESLSQLFRWGSLPRVRERFASRSGVNLDRASYSLIVPLADGSMRISELAQRSGVDVSTASRQVVQLEREGVVRRSRDAEDRRASILQLTPLGKRHLVKIAKARQEILAAVLSDFSDEDVHLLTHLLDRLNDNLVHYIEGDQ